MKRLYWRMLRQNMQAAAALRATQVTCGSRGSDIHPTTGRASCYKENGSNRRAATVATGIVASLKLLAVVMPISERAVLWLADLP